jgi:hypothetical protein
MQISVDHFGGRERKIGRGSQIVAWYQDRLADWPSVVRQLWLWLEEWVIGIFPGVKNYRSVRMTASPAPLSRLSRRCGSRKISQPGGPPRPVTAITLLSSFRYFHRDVFVNFGFHKFEPRFASSKSRISEVLLDLISFSREAILLERLAEPLQTNRKLLKLSHFIDAGVEALPLVVFSSSTIDYLKTNLTWFAPCEVRYSEP